MELAVLDTATVSHSSNETAGTSHAFLCSCTVFRGLRWTAKKRPEFPRDTVIVISARSSLHVSVKPLHTIDMSDNGLITNLHSTLKSLVASPFPFVAGPESIEKRASVALIIRFQPNYSHWPEKGLSPVKDIDSFFAQEWVKHGDPEILFIKRAARKGDRWTSHVALPGGRRDPEDADDQAAAIRETVEEVGIDLSPENAIPVGNLPQRVVTTSWGKVPYVSCSFYTQTKAK